jgi:hypothetical protein
LRRSKSDLMKAILSFILLASTPIAHARVGDTEAQLRKNFDRRPLSRREPNGLTRLTFPGRVPVDAWLLNGTVTVERYSNVGLLEAMKLRDSQGSKWREFIRTKEILVWSTKRMDAMYVGRDFIIGDRRSKLAKIASGEAPPSTGKPKS